MRADLRAPSRPPSRKRGTDRGRRFGSQRRIDESRASSSGGGAHFNGGNFSIVRAGAGGASTHRGFSGAPLQAIVEELARSADLVILDTTPVLGVSDALDLAPVVDAVLYGGGRQGCDAVGGRRRSSAASVRGSDRARRGRTESHARQAGAITISDMARLPRTTRPPTASARRSSMIPIGFPRLHEQAVLASRAACVSSHCIRVIYPGRPPVRIASSRMRRGFPAKEATTFTSGRHTDPRSRRSPSSGRHRHGMVAGSGRRSQAAAGNLPSTRGSLPQSLPHAFPGRSEGRLGCGRRRRDDAAQLPIDLFACHTAPRGRHL